MKRFAWICLALSPLLMGCGGGDPIGADITGADVTVTPDLGDKKDTANPDDTAKTEDTPNPDDATNPDIGPDIGPDAHTDAELKTDTGPVCPDSPCAEAGKSCVGNVQLICVMGSDGCFTTTETLCMDGDDNPTTCDAFTGECAQSCTGTAPNPAPIGPLHLDLTDVTFTTASVKITHKKDVDAFEDGCIADIEVYLSRPGCTMTLYSDAKLHETDPDGNLVIQSLKVSANSSCPGFPDAKEGTYQATAETPWTAAGLNLGVFAFSIDRVPGQNVASSCFVSTLEIRLFPAALSASGNKTIRTLETTITLSGEFTSAGDTEASCPCKARSEAKCETGADYGGEHSIWRDSCGRRNDVIESCVGQELCIFEAEAPICFCPNEWEGEGCDICPGNWDAAEGCGVCRNEWEGENCEVCPGNYDPEADCAVCRNAWEGYSCEVCPGNWDEAADCGSCRNHWQGDSCNSCPDAVSEDTDCSGCWLAWPAGKPYDYPGCYDTVKPHALSIGDANDGGTAMAEDGKIYVGGESGVQAFGADGEPLWSVGGEAAFTHKNVLYTQSFYTIRRYDAAGENVWNWGFYDANKPTFATDTEIWAGEYKDCEVRGIDGVAKPTYEMDYKSSGPYAVDAGGTVVYRPLFDSYYDDPGAWMPNWGNGPRIQAVKISDGTVLWELQRPYIKNDVHAQVSARAGGGVMIADLWGYLVLNADGSEVFELDGDPKEYSEMTVGEDGSIYAADAGRIRKWSAAGVELWAYEVSDKSWAYLRTPTIAADGSSYTSFAKPNGGAQGIMVLEADGTKRWSFLTQERCSDPIIDDDSWFWTACGEYLFRLPASAPLADSVWPRYRGGNGNAGY